MARQPSAPPPSAASDWEIESGFSVPFADNGFRTIRRLPSARFRQQVPSCSTGQRDGGVVPSLVGFLAAFALWPTLDGAPMRKLLCATAPVVLMCPLPVNPQQRPPAGPVELAVAPSHEQLGFEGDLGIEPAAPAQLQIAPKNDRLFWVLPNYLTVENRDQSGPLSAKTKFELSAKTMSVPVTISFIGAMALIDQARNSDPSYGQGLQGYAKRFGTFYADTGIGTLMLAPRDLFGEPNPRHSLGSRRSSIQLLRDRGQRRRGRSFERLPSTGSANTRRHGQCLGHRRHVERAL